MHANDNEQINPFSHLEKLMREVNQTIKQANELCDASEGLNRDLTAAIARLRGENHV